MQKALQIFPNDMTILKQTNWFLLFNSFTQLEYIMNQIDK